MTQEKRNYKPHAAAAVIAVVSAMVYNFEGERLHAYFDPPHVATICDGHTQGVNIKDVATPALCAKYRAEDIAVANGAVHRLVKKEMTAGQEEAFTDFVFNEGQGTFSRSSILRDFNASAFAQACHDLEKYNEAGGIVLDGLVARRKVEEQLCLGGG